MPCELENLALRIWLCLYNQMLGLSWLYVLFQIVQNLFVGGLESMNQTWDDLQWLLWRMQLFNMCDVLHALAGVWPVEAELSLLQRIWCKCGHRAEIFVTIFLVSNNIRPRWIFTPMILTWAIADVSRYQLYFFRTLQKTPPAWLRWLRYSDFIVQWPLNVIAEGACVFCAVPYLLSPSASSSWQGSLLSFVFSYAPIAIANQVRVWLRFRQGYRALWNIRTRRLCTFSPTTTRIDHCCAISASEHAAQRGADPEPKNSIAVTFDPRSNGSEVSLHRD